MPELLTRQTTSFSEYLLLPYDGKKTEFVNGQIANMAEASPLHADIIDFLTTLLKAHIKDCELNQVVRGGAIGIEIPQMTRDNNVRDPDVMVCDRTQWKAMRHLTKAIFCKGNPPALAIEVANPGDTTRDTVDKRLEYALAQVPEYWIINPVDGYVLVLVLDTASGTYEEVGEFRGAEKVASALYPTLDVTAAAMLDPE
ncbi:MAG: Uma2 family endonuclease [Cyanobacteria bacterium J06634_6]